MNRRTKQITYGGFYLVLWCLIGYGIYIATLKPPASCIDTIKNGDETEVDCGGPNCISCEVKHLDPIRMLEAKVLQASDSASTVVLEFRNPNAKYGAAKFDYRYVFYGSSTEPLYTAEDEVVIYPNGRTYQVLVNVPFKVQDVSLTAGTSTLTIWKPIVELTQPQIPVSNLKYQFSEGRGVITGLIRNENPYAIGSAIINGLVRDKKGNLVTASKTFIRDLESTQEREFKIAVLLPPGIATDTLAAPEVVVDARR